jgi:molecular chaperone Hsp33
VGELALGLTAAGLRWAVVDLTGPLEDARQRFDLSPVASVALGRVLAAAALMIRFTTKNPGRLTVEAIGDGPLGRVLGEVSSDGSLRGSVGEAHVSTLDSGSLAIGWAVGEGLFRVTRERATGGQYSSQVKLVNGEIGTDLAHYLQQSEQIRSAALVGVQLGSEGILTAGGLLVEALPGTPEEDVAQVEANIARLDGVSTRLASGGAVALADAVLEGIDHEPLERHVLVYRCRCDQASLGDRLATMATSDLDELTGADGAVEAVCAFCGQRYRFARESLSPIN